MPHLDFANLTPGVAILIGVAARIAVIWGQRPTSKTNGYRDRFGIEFGRMTRDQIEEAMRERRRRAR